MAVQAVKDHLNQTSASNANAEEVADFIRRAEQAIVRRVGHVKQPDDPISEFHHGGGSTIRVKALPLGVVDTITVQGTTVPAADLETGGRGWYVMDSDEGDLRAGIIRHTDRFPAGFVKVNFKPGRNPVPEDLELATLELIRHLWATQRGTGGARPGLRGEQPVDSPDVGPRGGATSAGFTYPKRVMELIQPYLLVPVA